MNHRLKYHKKLCSIFDSEDLKYDGFDKSEKTKYDDVSNNSDDKVEESSSEKDERIVRHEKM